MPAIEKKRLHHADYKIGWACILEVEFIAAVSMLDQEHERLSSHPNDPIVYSVGRIGSHNVVIAYPLHAGVSPAQTLVENMRTSFPCVQFALLVGIGGGVPRSTGAGAIRLGDVVVGKSNDSSSAVVHYDRSTGSSATFVPPPSLELLKAAEDASKRARQYNTITANCGRINTSLPRMKCFKFPGAGADTLYQSDHIHAQPKIPCERSGCDSRRLVQRPSDARRRDDCPIIHWGKVASGDQVMKDALLRDQLAHQHGIICFEMEAAGVMTRLPCLVVRGISDYCDSHKNDDWQAYAAAVAGGFAREVCLSYQTRRCHEDSVCLFGSQS
ncbi:5'-methylthioadenosine/S-adenosylhomocysteine nucleosidase family protein [Aspergillus lucknowensis]|uniref:Nucleoside phosphorylase domain-containing protein n=1 Tax=Aspergillus lucknowensis TaxID=176173 RepID=A0ABR4LCY4_9EURO